MRRRLTTVALAAIALLLTSAVPALAGRSSGTAGQIAWVRSATSRFLTAELQGNGASACSILNAPLRATRDHRTCTQRWDERLAAMRHEPAMSAHLRSDRRAVPSAQVQVDGYEATIALPTPLMGAESRLVWSENCWMVTH